MILSLPKNSLAIKLKLWNNFFNLNKKNLSVS